MRQITGSDDIALGHFCTFGYMFTALIAKLTGDKSKSTEDVALPKSLEFLQDTYLSVMVVMVPFYLIVAIFAGPKACAEYAGATNYIVFMFLQALQFVTGLYVLMAGVRLLLAELVPAFQGISMKLVPNSKLPSIIPICTKRSNLRIHLYNNRIYHRYVLNTNAWITNDLTWSYE